MHRAKRVLKLSLVGAFCIAVCYAIFMTVCRHPLLLLIGGDAGTIGYAESYVFWTIMVGGIPTIMAPVCGHLIRAMGHPRQASFGMILGALLNIGFDPLFMFVLFPRGNEVMGAAIVTALFNCLSLVYYVILFCVHKILEKAHGSQGGTGELILEIIKGGIPSFFMVALAMVSNCFLNSMISTLGSEAVAGLGIVRKIDQLAYAVNQGITQGMLPLAAYCYASIITALPGSCSVQSTAFMRWINRRI
ncbi:MAG: MATE family efflux transporter [Acetatifactor muris]|nr:MATE family efflux transporter [Acetatifactor muris]